VSLQEALGLLDQGGAAAMRGDREGAERAFARAIELHPEIPEAHYNLGLVLQESGRAEDAMARYRAAIALRAAFPEAHNNLGNLLLAHGRLEEASGEYTLALRYNPNLAQARDNLARALDRRGTELAAQGEWERAEACYRQALQARPGVAGTHNNLGHVLQQRDDPAGAAAEYARALALDPRYADAIANTGLLLEEQGKRDEAMEHYRRALAVDARHARAAYNLGLAYLHRADFAAGWGLTESRFDTLPPVAARPNLSLPGFTARDWGGGHRLAVWKEQGVGDQLVHATVLPELEARGEEFVVEVDRRLVAAFARAHPRWNVVAPEQAAAAFSACDRQIAIGSLAGLLRRDAASFAGQPQALLAADPARARSIRATLGAGAARVIGISWRSFQPRARGRLVRDKSAPLAAFGALSRRPDLRLLDLQYGNTEAERDAFAAGGGKLERVAGLDLFEDIDGVLAAVAACDVVVTTSNVTAHFAGALGKRTLLLYLRGVAPFHYWVPGPDGRSRWYPSVEIVSGETWEAALARAHELLG
jgi:tetratricopeptide (TPR) repeat protein